jgi:hypothetical protein
MQPPSFDEFISKSKSTCAPGVTQVANEIEFDNCPTPGCGCKEIIPRSENGVFTSFSCDGGCVFSVKRNAFTGDIVYFKLERFNESRFKQPENIRGMKFNPCGEPYTDWY